VPPDRLPPGARFWEESYASHREGWFFGDEPSTLARRLLHFFRLMEIPSKGRLLELGSGEGRDVVLFASAGFEVEAIDGSPTGVARTRRALDRAGLRSSVALGDIAAYSLQGPYDVVFANNSLQFVGGAAPERIRSIREHTRPGGWNAVGMFTREETEGKSEPDVYLLASRELKSLYDDWQLFEYGESIIYSPRRAAYRSFASLIARRPV
jgi:tellurite methyltransferase